MKQLYPISAQACQDVYNRNVDLGTTEYYSEIKWYNGKQIQALSIAGTNEKEDWLKNISLWSEKGIKKVAVQAATEIKNHFVRLPDIPLLVCGHSKAGPTAIAYKRLFGADWCVAFAPARSLRYWTNRTMRNTTIFVDPDDPVSKVGFLSFGHPKCRIITAKNNHVGISVGDHFMDNWVRFVDKMCS